MTTYILRTDDGKEWTLPAGNPRSVRIAAYNILFRERVFPLRYDTLKGDRLDLRIESGDPDLVDVMRRLFAYHDLEITEFDSDECYIVISKPEWSR